MSSTRQHRGTAAARALRKRSTNAERLFWKHIRDRQLNGAKFRRQQPIGPYIVDFFCPEAGVIVELDGGQHDEEINRECDELRTKFLNDAGYKVIRFWNNEALTNIEGVWHKIERALKS